MDEFVGIVIACLAAAAAVGGAWIKQKKAKAGSPIAAGLVFSAQSMSALVLLAGVMNGYAEAVGWQAAGAAAFVASTPLLFALAVLTEARGRAA